MSGTSSRNRRSGEVLSRTVTASEGGRPRTSAARAGVSGGEPAVSSGCSRAPSPASSSIASASREHLRLDRGEAGRGRQLIERGSPAVGGELRGELSETAAVVGDRRRQLAPSVVVSGAALSEQAEPVQEGVEVGVVDLPPRVDGHGVTSKLAASMLSAPSTRTLTG